MYVKAIIKNSKKDIRADGRTPIYIALRQNRKEKLIVTEKKIRPEHWNDQAGLPSQSAPNYILLKKWINEEIERIEGIILKLEVSKKLPTFENVLEMYKLGNEITVPIFCRHELEKEKIHIKLKTYEDYERSIKNIEEYQADVSFSTIDDEWLKEYSYYGLNVKEWSPNTLAHDYRMLNKFFRKAIKKGIAINNPIEGVKIPKREVDKEYNTPKEVEELDALFWKQTLPLRLQKTLGFYLFSCYTCISGHDLRKKAFVHQLHKNSIKYRREKTARTGKLLEIPLIDDAQKLLPFILKYTLKQKINRVTVDLEEIMAKAGISKHITFHCARISFYVLARKYRVDERTIQDVFGHSSIQTTNIYKKILNEEIESEMYKMNKKS